MMDLAIAKPPVARYLKRLTLFIIVNGLAGVGAIPLIAFYGLRVCPTLEALGFRSGCYYVGTFVTLSLGLNFAFLARALIRSSRTQGLTANAILKLPRLSFFAYAASTIVAVLVLNVLFKAHHLSSQSRAPEILVFLSFLLGILQFYSAAWMIQPILASTQTASATRTEEFRSNWVSTLSFNFLPILVAIGFLLHFLVSQSSSFNNGSVATPLALDAFIQSTTQVLVFVLVWLIAVYAFFFATEFDQAERVRRHLDHIAKLDAAYASSEAATGFWKNILASLNRTSRLLREKSRLVENFAKFVAQSVAEQASDRAIEIGGTRRDLTVFMSDLRGFTQLSHKLRPEAVVQLLNIYFTGMLEELSLHGVAVDKFIGDGILGYVQPQNEKGPGNARWENEIAVKAAFAMLTRLKLVNEELRRESLPELSLGIGICRGPVVLGNIGSKTRMQYTVIGDAVNRAARLESLCKKTGTPLVIDHDLNEMLSSELQHYFRDLGDHAVAGLEKIHIHGLDSANVTRLVS